MGKSTRAFFFCLSMAARLAAQDQPGSDVIVFTDGEKLIGHLISSAGPKVVFDSNVAGQVTVEWSKVQELRSADKFAVIKKDAAIHAAGDAATVPQGAVDVKDQKLELTTVASPAPQTIPLSDVSEVVNEKKFERGFERQSFFRGWNGVATLGFNFVQGTATSRILNTVLFLEHDDPPASSWLPARTKTFLNFNSAYEFTNSFGAETKVSRWHADLERDYYIKPRTFILVGGLWEHNYTQGLDLTQAYGTGIGYNLVKKEQDQLDVRAGIGFMYQQWEDPMLNRALFGSRFGIAYTHTWSNGISISTDAGVRPAWNYMHAFFGGVVSSVTIPMYHRFKFSVNGTDSFVNNPPPFFKKNLFLASVGASYVFR